MVSSPALLMPALLMQQAVVPVLQGVQVGQHVSCSACNMLCAGLNNCI